MDEYENVEDSTTHVYSGLGYGPYYMSEFGGDEYIVLVKKIRITHWKKDRL